MRKGRLRKIIGGSPSSTLKKMRLVATFSRARAAPLWLIKRGLTHSRALRFYSVQYLGSSGVSKLCLVPYTEQTKDTKTLDRTSTLLAAKMM
jgi:hypothetical protein